MIKKIHAFMRSQLSFDNTSSFGSETSAVQDLLRRKVNKLALANKLSKQGHTHTNNSYFAHKLNEKLAYYQPSLLQKLEPRLMFDGAAFITVDLADGVSQEEQSSVLDAVNTNEHADAGKSLFDALSLDAPSEVIDYSKYKEVMIIDAKVKDPHVLIANINRDAAIEVILSREDGVDAIAKILEKYNNLSAIHIVSHGDQGALNLGSVTLNSDNLNSYQSELAAWGHALSQTGDILFYGCNVAEGAKGQDFVDQLKALTDTDIAASDDLTSSNSNGGDGQLEYSSDIDVDTILSFEQYSHVLINEAPTLTFESWAQLGQDIDGAAANDQSGSSVSMSADGTRVVIGSPYNDATGTDAGKVRIYNYNGSTWVQIGQDINGEASGDKSGHSVAMSADGTRVAIGATENDGNGSNSGQVRIYEWDTQTSTWIKLGQDIDGEASSDNSGGTLSLSSDGSRIAIGASRNDGNGFDSGHVRVYNWNGSAWIQLGVDINGEAAGDLSGVSVSLSADGMRMVIGASNNNNGVSINGHARVYEWNGSAWVQLGQDIDGEAANDKSGYSVAMSADGTRVAIGAPDNDGTSSNSNFRSGHVRIYQWDGGGNIWVQLGQDIDDDSPNSQLGGSLSWSADGKRIAIGAAGKWGSNGMFSGVVKIYQWDEFGNNWVQFGDNINGEASSDQIGMAVEISADGTRVVTGAPFNDGNGSNSGHVRGYHRAPVPITYVENAVATVINNKIVVTDLDSTNLTSATISISANYINGEDILAFTNTANITGNFNATTGVLTLTGTDTLANYQAALRSVKYQNTSDTPSTATRTVSWVINDGVDSSTTVTSTINVAAVNDKPVLSLEGSLSYTENSTATVINNTLTVNDVDDIQLESATVSIFMNYVNGQDILAFANMGNISGSFNATTGVLTLTGTDTLANYQAALRSVTYQNISDSPTTSTRWLSWVANDGTTNSTAVTSTISIITVNDKSVVTAGASLSYTENNIPTVIDNTISVSDVDDTNIESATVSISGNYVNGQDILAFANTGNISGSFNATTGVLTLTGSDTLANYQAALRGVKYQNSSDNPSTLARTISWVVNDGSASSTAVTSIINITAVDDAPVHTVPGAQSVTEDTPLAITGISVNDVDGNFSSTRLEVTDGTLTVTLVGGATISSGGNARSQLTISGSQADVNATLASLRYQGNLDFHGSDTLTITSVSNAGLPVTSVSTLAITVNPANDTPVLLLDQIVEKLAQDIDGEAEWDFGGSALALSSDGTRVVIGATGNNSDTGHMRIYEYNGTSWIQMGDAIAGETFGDWAGTSVSMSVNGLRIAIGAPGNDTGGADRGRVQIYEWNGSAWVQMGNDINGESNSDSFGESVSLSADGLKVAIGAFANGGNGLNSGHVKIYQWNAGSSAWVQLGTNINGESAGDNSGRSVSLSADGFRVAIGAFGSDGTASNAGHVRVYEYQDSDWVQLGLDIDGEAYDDRSGWSVSLSSDGRRVVIGAYANDSDGRDGENNFGQVRVYQYTGGNWVKMGEDIDGEIGRSESGWSVAINADGSRIAIGAHIDSKDFNDFFFSGAARIYDWNGSAWVQMASTIYGEFGDDRSGTSVALSADGTHVAIGAIKNADNGQNSGHTRIYQLKSPIIPPMEYTENDPATIIHHTIALSDADDTHLESATVTISANYVEGEDILAFTNMGSITGSFNADTGALTLTGSDTLANYQAALRSVKYQNTSDNPSTLVRTISWKVNDGDIDSTIASSTINITPVNDVSVVTAGATVNYTENATATVIDNTTTINDVDNTTLQNATVTISANYINGQDILGFINTGNITGSFNATTGVLTLTGSDTLANYQAALRSVTYQNTSDNPSTLVRTISWKVNDGDIDSTIASSTINITPVNDASVVTAGATVSYTENTAATVIDNTVTINDVDNTTLQNATVTISANYINGQDILGFVNTGNITGSFNATTGVLTLTGSDTLANYQTVLRSVTYRNTSENPSELARTISWKVNDETADSTIVTSTINIAAVNDIPALTAGAIVSYAENAAATVIDNTVTINDVDNTTLQNATVTISANYINGQDILGFVNTGNITGSFNATTGVLTLTGSDTLANYQTVLRSVTYRNTSENPSELARTISWKVNDQTADSTIATSKINLTAVNDAPTAANKTVATNEDTDYTFVASDFNFADIDGDSLASVKITNLATTGSLQLNGMAIASTDQVITKAEIDAGLLKFISEANANGRNYARFGFKVNDSVDDSVATYTMAIDLTPVNDVPQGEINIVGKREVGQVLTVVNTITDVDGLGSFSYQWQRDNENILGATNNSYTLTGDDVGKIVQVKITYVDGNGNVELITSSSGSNLLIRSAPIVQSNLDSSAMLIERSVTKLSSTDTEIESLSLSSSIESISVTAELHYSLDLFSQALTEKVSDKTLAEIAANIFKAAIQDPTQTQVVGNLLQKAIDANEPASRVGFVASGILNASVDTQISTEVIAQTIVQQIVESNLTGQEVSQTISTMVVESADSIRSEVMQSILTEPKITEEQIKKIYNDLKNQNPEFAKQFAEKVAAVKKMEIISSIREKSLGLLAKLKIRFLSDTQAMHQPAITYSEQEHAFNIKLARAKLMRFVA